jgi:hypothetical protein
MEKIMTKQLDCKYQLLSRKEAALLLGVKPQTLAVWALTKRENLRVTKIGRHSKYLLSDIEAYLMRSTDNNDYE